MVLLGVRRNTGLWRVQCWAGVVAGVLVLQLILPVQAADPCSAKQAYEAAQQQEREAYSKLEKVPAPGSVRPPGPVADLRAIVQKTRSNPNYRTAEQLEALNEQSRSLSKARRTAEVKAEELRGQLTRLKGELRGSDDARRQQELRQQIEETQYALDACNTLAFESRTQLTSVNEQIRRAQPLEVQLDVAAKHLAVAERWVNFDQARNNWIAADAQVKRTKQDYDRAVADKNAILANAKARFNQEQARIQRVTASLNGRPRNEAYYDKANQMALHALSTYENLLVALARFDCFPDVRTFMDSVQVRVQRVKSLREQIRTARAGKAGATGGTRAALVTFGLVGKKLGYVPGPGGNNNSTVQGSMTESSFSVEIRMKPPYEGVAEVKHAYSNNLSATLKPGEVIELTCTSSATKSGTDAPNIGSSASWQVEGNVQILEQTKTYAGTASDGKFYPASSAKTRFKVGNGGKIIIRAVQGGQLWGGSDNWNPVEYTYESGSLATEKIGE